MVKELFASLLEELGRTIELPDLHPDRNHSCLITFPNELKIQLEMDSMAQHVILGCDLGAVPSGRYRENVLREALKANGLPAPHHGFLAFSNKTDHLILFDYLSTKELTGEKIADALTPFSEKAHHWKDSLTKGEMPSVGTLRTSGGMFGLRP